MASCLGIRICVHALHKDGTGNNNNTAIYVVTALNNVPNMSHRIGKKIEL
jgi:hypothetical protein